MLSDKYIVLNIILFLMINLKSVMIRNHTAHIMYVLLYTHN